MTGLVLANPQSGPTTADPDELREAFPGAEVVSCEPGRLDEQVARALDCPPPDYVAVAGGDGTMRSVAAVLMDKGIPLVPVPAGTRNHFARAVGIDDVKAAGEAVNGEQCAVDVGDVNGHLFLNNSSIGAYPKFVQKRERHERRMSKRLAQLLAAWHQLRGGRAYDVTIDAEQLRVWLVFVGNGAYGMDLSDLAQRRSLTDHELDVRIVRADLRWSRLRLFGALIFGRLEHTPVVQQRRCAEVKIDADRSVVQVALDGEVEEIETPLHYRTRPEALTIRVPA